MTISDPWYGTAGSRNPKIILVGEAWGAEEDKHKTPFIGQSGRELFRMLGASLKLELPLLNEALSQRTTEAWRLMRDQWLARTGILLCNTIAARPPGNDYSHFLISNQQAKKQNAPNYYGIYPANNLMQGINNLWHLINHLNPQLIIAAGNWPLHVLTSHATPKTTKGFKLPTGISTWRGSQTYTRSQQTFPGDKRLPLTPIPCLPIIHPASILRDWSDHHVTVHDLRARAGRFISNERSWEAPPDNAISAPTFLQVKSILENWITQANLGPLSLACDIETYAKKYITCVGLCDASLSLCIPIFYFDSSQRSIAYFKPEEELEIWRLLKLLLEHPNVFIIGQNFIYDTQYFARYYCIEALVDGDTMVAHHLLFPGTPMSLARLASLYNDHYCFWKDESEEWAANELSAQDLWKYNCKDVRATYEAWFLLARLLDKYGLSNHYKNRIKAWKASRRITIRGVRYDNSIRNQYLSKISLETSKLEAWLMLAVPEQFRHTASGKPWFSHPGTIMHLLYHVLGIKPILHKKTKRPTTDDAAINELCERKDCEWLSPLLEALQELRSALVSTRNFLSVTLDQGRLTSQFNIARPETFRWSSKDNAFGEGGTMQNLPKGDD